MLQHQKPGQGHHTPSGCLRWRQSLLHDSVKSKGISKLRLWGKIRRFNGINNLPEFMQHRLDKEGTQPIKGLLLLAVEFSLEITPIGVDNHT